MIGRTVSHYRINAQLGAGGMGVVYRAEDTRLGRSVALKFLSEHLAHDDDAVRRLRSEARAASALNHGGICTIYDIDEVEGHPFIVMELLKGRSLRDLLTSAPLKVHQLVDIGIEIADALQAAHAEGIVHRDITPANIFVTDQGHVKILDFGLAKLASFAAGPSTTMDTTHQTAKGITLGTVAYMSPEQATGDALDARTDLFSTGVVLYECATARHPFPGKTSPVILAAILNRAPVAPIAESRSPAAPSGGHQQLPREGSGAAVSVCRRPPRRPETRAPRSRFRAVTHRRGGHADGKWHARDQDGARAVNTRTLDRSRCSCDGCACGVCR
jgi:serine/threonine protein kinase